MRACALLACALLLGGCASTAVVTQGGGVSLMTAQSEPALGGKYRIAVGSIIDKSSGAGDKSLARQLDRLNAGRAPEAMLTVQGLAYGVQDLLVTELFGAGRFIVLERAALDDVVTEQEFSRSADAGDETRIPKGKLEGAELIVLGAITAFDAGADAGALPIPIPLGDRGDFGVFKLRFARGYIAMDLRVVDARTGRVLSTVAVEGRNSRFGMDFDAHLIGAHHYVKLPGVLTYFQNTPVEKALQQMVTAAVAHVAARLPAEPVTASP
jgi:curli biogenesis system outer membrane secretion channel CsgG